MPDCIFEAQEHEIQNLDLEILEKINNEKDEFKYLNIRKEKNKENQAIAYYYIGYRWFEKNKSYICVKPKEVDVGKGKKADFLKMFLEVLNDPIVSKKVDKVYKIFFDEPLIEVNTNEYLATEFLIIHFLKIVNEIAKKGLKKGYLKVEENLTSKIKGKILINKTIKHNLSKNRLDKTYCNHQIFTINCLENQILKTALIQCSRALYLFKNENITKMYKQNLSAFELVNTKEVFNTDFFKIKHSPFFKEYKIALNLAKLIFKRFGFSLNSKETTNKIFPYYIDMPELFERYVEVKLREKYKDLIDGNQRNYTFKMRPDFLLPSKKFVIDAKYKFWYEKESNSNFKDDYMQLSLYGRDKKIREELNVSDNEIVDLVFIYPSEEGDEKINLDAKKADEKFCKIYKYALNIPFTTQ